MDEKEAEKENLERERAAVEAVRRRQESNSELFDKTVVYIAAGSAIFSITYRAQYAKNAPLCNAILLEWSIGLLLATLCLSLFSFVASSIVLGRQHEEIEDYYANDKMPQDGVWEHLARHLPKVYGGLLILSLILAGFAILGDFTAQIFSCA